MSSSNIRKVQRIVAQAEEELREGGLWNMLEAKDLLLEAGFVRERDPDVQAAFYRLFPPTKELQRTRRVASGACSCVATGPW